MGMSISSEQNAAAAAAFAEQVERQFGGSGVTVSVENHNNAAKYAFIRMTCPPQHWIAVAKWMRFDGGVNYCSMVTGTHYPEGTDRGWGVAYHFLRQPVRDVNPFTADVLKASELEGISIPLEVEVLIDLPKGDAPVVPSVQSIWIGADWNEKETWALVGIRFEGHQNMHRVLNPHDSPEGFPPLQKQHQIRYHDFNEMYDDAQGFVRKPSDEGRVK